MVERDTGRSRGFGFVSFDAFDAADAALRALDGHPVGNKRLKVTHKKNKDGSFEGPGMQQPQQHGDAGMEHMGGMHPDGMLAAVGGHTGPEGSGAVPHPHSHHAHGGHLGHVHGSDPYASPSQPSASHAPSTAAQPQQQRQQQQPQQQQHGATTDTEAAGDAANAQSPAVPHVGGPSDVPA
jgi:RNA recognition motif-containing protein